MFSLNFSSNAELPKPWRLNALPCKNDKFVLRIGRHTETRWSPGDADRDADRERTSRMQTCGMSAASSGPGPGELSTLSPFAENAWVYKQLQDALGREDKHNDLSAIQQKEIHKLRKELDLERRDLFDAGDGTGAGSKRKHASSQPLGVAQTLALEQKYLQAVAQTNADGVARIGTKRLSANMRIQPEAKAGLLELANILGAATTGTRYGGQVSLSPTLAGACKVSGCVRAARVLCVRRPGARVP